MNAKASEVGDLLPSGHLLTYLPAIGANGRLPNFWSDREVRKLVVGLHRQMRIDQALAQIREAVGAERTPSKSAFQRCWARIDKAIAQGRVLPVRGSRA